MTEKLNGFKDDDFVEVQIPVPWGHITGKWWGPRNIQPIIALHGWQDNCGTFDPLASLLLKKDLSVYCIDLPGHGFSSPIPAGQKYNLFWDGVHYLRRIVKYFDWKDISIIGHSLGGGIAFLYAAVYPEEVKKYVSIDIASPAIGHPNKTVAQVGRAIDKFLEYENKRMDELPAYSYDEMLGILEDAYKGSVSKQGCEILLRRGMKPAQEKEGFRFTRDPRLKVAVLGYMSVDQVLGYAERIKCEVMNIRAIDGLKFEHYDLVLDTIEMSAKRMERHFFSGTHHLHLNNAETIAPSIYTFLTT